MNNEFNLTYWHKTIPGKKLLAKKTMPGHYCVLDPETQEKKHVTQGILIKDYAADSGNYSAGRAKTARMRGLNRMKGRRSQAFQAYLRGET